MAFQQLDLHGLRPSNNRTTPLLLSTLKDAADQGRDLNSELPIADDRRRAVLMSKFGATVTFGYYFHELFMRRVVDAVTPSHLKAPP